MLALSVGLAISPRQANEPLQLKKRQSFDYLAQRGGGRLLAVRVEVGEHPAGVILDLTVFEREGAREVRSVEEDGAAVVGVGRVGEQGAVEAAVPEGDVLAGAREQYGLERARARLGLKLDALDEHIVGVNGEPAVDNAPALERLVDGAALADSVQADVVADDDEVRTGGRDGNALGNHLGVADEQRGLVVDVARGREEAAELGVPNIERVLVLALLEHRARPCEQGPVGTEVGIVSLHAARS